jgi:hypothetical protein
MNLLGKLIISVVKLCGIKMSFAQMIHGTLIRNINVDGAAIITVGIGQA